MVDWRNTKLAEIGSFRNGVNFTKDDMGSGLRVINVKDVFVDGVEIDFDRLDRVNFDGKRGIEKYQVQANDLCSVKHPIYPTTRHIQRFTRPFHANLSS
ncbi:MAG: hypothetical protein GYB66_06785 [Chloroflexi bacterium]|nr:hypothetical protein [Chloroflexota bacterium]